MAIDIAHCTAAGLGVSGTTTFTRAEVDIQARDNLGNPVLVGGQVWDISVNGVVLGYTDNGDGTYTVPGYITSKAGNYTLSITAGAVNIINSPFTVPFTTI